MSTDDAERSTILAAARAQRKLHVRALLGGILVLLVCVAVASYRASPNARWGWVGIIVAVQIIILVFQVLGLRVTSPASPGIRALLDEPTRVAGIETRRAAVFVYLDTFKFTVLRPPGAVDTFVAMLHARCPQAMRGRPPRLTRSTPPRTDS